MLIQLPGGTALNVDGSEVSAADNGEISLHTPLALSRLIERWKAETHPNLAGLLSSYVDQAQTLENAIWDTIVARLPDYAEGVQLDALGRLVGQRRNGLGDAAYRAHIKARIRINQSFGQARDLIAVLRLVDPDVVYRLQEVGTARFFIWSDIPPSNAAIGHELPELVRQTRAAGVGALVAFPVDRVDLRGAFFGTSYNPTLNSARGFSSSYNVDVGGLWSHGARA